MSINIRQKPSKPHKHKAATVFRRVRFELGGHVPFSLAKEIIISARLETAEAQREYEKIQRPLKKYSVLLQGFPNWTGIPVEKKMIESAVINICGVCNKPQHSYSEIGENKIVLCPEMPKDVVVFMDNYICGCCKCADKEFPEKSPIIK